MMCLNCDKNCESSVCWAKDGKILMPFCSRKCAEAFRETEDSENKDGF